MALCLAQSLGFGQPFIDWVQGCLAVPAFVMSLIVTSYNIGVGSDAAWGLKNGQRRRCIDDILTQANYSDILLLQELGHATLGVDTAILAELQERLRDSDRVLVFEDSYAFVRRSNLPGSFDVNPCQLDTQQEKARFCQLIRWCLAGDVIHLANVHLRSSKKCPLTDGTRKEAVSSLLRKLQPISQVVLVAGDVNCRRQDSSQQRVLEAVCREHIKATHLRNADDSEASNAWIFGTTATVLPPLGLFASDAHRPLILRLDWPYLSAHVDAALVIMAPVHNTPSFKDVAITNPSSTSGVTAFLPLAPRPHWRRVACDFDATGYGDEYLSIRLGDIVAVCAPSPHEISLGWIKVRMVLDGVVNTAEGWVPPAYLERF